MAPTIADLPNIALDRIFLLVGQPVLLAQVCHRWSAHIWDLAFWGRRPFLSLLHQMLPNPRLWTNVHMPELILNPVELIGNLDESINPAHFRRLTLIHLACPGKVGGVNMVRERGEELKRIARIAGGDMDAFFGKPTETDEEPEEPEEPDSDPEYDNPMDLLDATSLTRFIGPEIRGFQSNCRVLTNAVLPHLTRRCPKIQVVILSGEEFEHGDCDHARDKNPVPGLRLQQVKAPKHALQVTKLLLEYLNTNTSLREVHIRSANDVLLSAKDPNSMSIADRLLSYDGLEKLSLAFPRSEVRRWHWPWIQHFGPSLEHLYVQYPPRGLQSQIARLEKLTCLQIYLDAQVNEFLIDVGNLPNLRTLELDVVPDVDRTADQPVEIQWEALETVSYLKHLETFCIRARRGKARVELPFTDNRFQLFVSRLPRLRILLFRLDCDISFSSLVALGRSCPKLVHLGLKTPFAWPQLAKVPGPLFPNLEFWALYAQNIGEVKIPLPVARQFGKLNRRYRRSPMYSAVLDEAMRTKPGAVYLPWLFRMHAPKLERWNLKPEPDDVNYRPAGAMDTCRIMMSAIMPFENAVPGSKQESAMVKGGVGNAIVNRQVNSVALQQAMNWINSNQVEEASIA